MCCSAPEYTVVSSCRRKGMLCGVHAETLCLLKYGFNPWSSALLSMEERICLQISIPLTYLEIRPLTAPVVYSSSWPRKTSTTTPVNFLSLSELAFLDLAFFFWGGLNHCQKKKMVFPGKRSGRQSKLWLVWWWTISRGRMIQYTVLGDGKRERQETGKKKKRWEKDFDVACSCH